MKRFFLGSFIAIGLLFLNACRSGGGESILSSSGEAALDDARLEKFGNLYASRPSDSDIVKKLNDIWSGVDSLTYLGKSEIAPDSHYEVFFQIVYDEDFQVPSGFLQLKTETRSQNKVKKVELKSLDSGLWFFVTQDENFKESYYFLDI